MKLPRNKWQRLSIVCVIIVFRPLRTMDTINFAQTRLIVLSSLCSERLWRLFCPERSYRYNLFIVTSGEVYYRYNCIHFDYFKVLRRTLTVVMLFLLFVILFIFISAQTKSRAIVSK